MRYPCEFWVPNEEELGSAKRDAAWLLRNVRNVVLGTVGADGAPHTTVLGKNFRMLPGDSPGGVDAAMFFWSFPDTRHAQNIERVPGQRLRVQLLEAGRNFGALALAGTGRRLSLDETRYVLPEFNERRKHMEAMPPRFIEEFTDPDYPKAMYRVRFLSEAELPVRGMDPEGRWAGDIAFRVPLNEII